MVSFTGFCAEFNVDSGAIQIHRSAQCNRAFPKCDDIYVSSNAYKCKSTHAIWFISIICWCFCVSHVCWSMLSLFDNRLITLVSALSLLSIQHWLSNKLKTNRKFGKRSKFNYCRNHIYSGPFVCMYVPGFMWL